MDILLACPAKDNQSARFINDALIELDHRVAVFDWRDISQEHGTEGMNKVFIETHDDLKPELTIIIKGLGISGETVKKIKETHNTKFVYWIFDITIGGQKVLDFPKMKGLIEEMDLFYSIDENTVRKVRDIGIRSKWLSQACHPPVHKEVVFNSIQRRRFGADVMFAGSIGGIHETRTRILKRIHDEGFNFKIYGEVYFPPNAVPDWVNEHHTGFAITDDIHSLACGASKIVIGNDAFDDNDKAYSLRLYKVLCAGGFYLTSHTPNIEEHFVPGVHLETYKDEDELVEKIIQYLSDDESRNKIALAGQKEVLEKHTQEIRMSEMLEDVKTLYK